MRQLRTPKKKPFRKLQAVTRGGTSVAGTPRRRRWLVVLLAIGLACAGLYLARRPILGAMGRMLVVSDRLEKADAALVLAGDESYEGNRLRAAVQLYRDGWVRKLALSGGRTGYGVYETDFSVPLAISLGVPRSDLMALPHQARSTNDEVRHLAPILERSGIRSVYIVSDNFHTRRARKLFLRASGGRMRVLAHPASNGFYDPDHWWQTREGRKVFLLEFAKHINSYFQ